MGLVFPHRHPEVRPPRKRGEPRRIDRPELGLSPPLSADPPPPLSSSWPGLDPAIHALGFRIRSNLFHLLFTGRPLTCSACKLQVPRPCSACKSLLFTGSPVNRPRPGGTRWLWRAGTGTAESSVSCLNTKQCTYIDVIRQPRIRAPRALPLHDASAMKADRHTRP